MNWDSQGKHLPGQDKPRRPRRHRLVRTFLTKIKPRRWRGVGRGDGLPRRSLRAPARLCLMAPAGRAGRAAGPSPALIPLAAEAGVGPWVLFGCGRDDRRCGRRRLAVRRSLPRRLPPAWRRMARLRWRRGCGDGSAGVRPSRWRMGARPWRDHVVVCCRLAWWSPRPVADPRHGAGVCRFSRDDVEGGRLSLRTPSVDCGYLLHFGPSAVGLPCGGVGGCADA